MLFLTACGPSDGSIAPQVDATQTGAATSLPAVWNTSDLHATVSDIALAGGGASMLAVAYEGGGLEIFDLEGDRLSEIAPLTMSQIAEGAFGDFGAIPLAVFPGIDARGALVAVLFGEGLGAPQQTPINVEVDGRVEAVCSQPLNTGSDTILEVAFWTDTAPAEVRRGTLTTAEDALVYEELETASRPEESDACAFVDGELVFGRGPMGLAGLSRPGAGYLIAPRQDGRLDVTLMGEPAKVFDIRAGLSVAPPNPIRAIAALGQPRGGGYPEGVIIVAGAVRDGDQAVFIDAGGLAEVFAETAPAE